jgi:hypothetical protein
MIIKGISEPKKDGVTGGWRKLKMSSSVICTLHKIFFV